MHFLIGWLIQSLSLLLRARYWLHLGAHRLGTRPHQGHPCGLMIVEPINISIGSSLVTDTLANCRVQFFYLPGRCAFVLHVRTMCLLSLDVQSVRGRDVWNLSLHRSILVLTFFDVIIPSRGAWCYDCIDCSLLPPWFEVSWVSWATDLERDECIVVLVS